MIEYDVVLAATLLRELADRGLVEFVSSRGPDALAPAFAGVLEEIDDKEDRGSAMADWLIEQAEVGELYGEDEDLARCLDALAGAEEPDEPDDGDATALTELLRASLGWVAELELDVGTSRPLATEVYFEGCVDGPDERAKRVLASIAESFSEVWPTIVDRLVATHAKIKGGEDLLRALDSLSLHVPPQEEQPGAWSVQITLDLPGEGDTGYFVDIREGKVVGCSAVE